MDVILVTGGLNYADIETIRAALEPFPAGTLVLHGGAMGADSLAHDVAREQRKHTAVVEYPGWLRAVGGPVRNRLMIEMAVAMRERGHRVVVLAFGGDRGTSDCLGAAEHEAMEIHRFD